MISNCSFIDNIDFYHLIKMLSARFPFHNYMTLGVTLEGEHWKQNLTSHEYLVTTIWLVWFGFAWFGLVWLLIPRMGGVAI